MKNFSRTAANLLASMTKIDSCYYPEVFVPFFPKASLFFSSPFNLYVKHLHFYLQTLHQMYVVNAGSGFKKMLWPAAQKFLDPKTIAKIQVKYINYQQVMFNMLISSNAADFTLISLLFRFLIPSLYINYRKPFTLGTSLCLHLTAL